MEIYAQNEAFVEKDGDIEFVHTKVILKENDRFFYTTTERRLLPGIKLDFNASSLKEIPTDRVWAEVDPDFTRAPEPLPPDCYIKEPVLIEYGDTEASMDPGAILLHEARVCEILRKYPHPNIARFHGCIIEGKRLKGLCFSKYSRTLLQKAREPTTLDVDTCMRGIEAGVHHLHRLGLVHNDLNPANIMMDGDTPVIIDFDSCRKEGADLGVKGGTLGWDECDAHVSNRENDLRALPKIREFLEQAQNCK